MILSPSAATHSFSEGVALPPNGAFACVPLEVLVDPEAVVTPFVFVWNELIPQEKETGPA